MTDLDPVSALADPAPIHAGALTLAPDEGMALASLALRHGVAPPAPMGLVLPGPGRWVADPQIAAFWTGPGQWMIEAPGQADQDVAARLAEAAPGCSVTEQTDGWIVFQIASSQGAAPVMALMEKLVNLDSDAFGPGSATRTLLHHLGVYVIRRAEDRLAVIGMRSQAEDLWHALGLAARRLTGDAA